MGIKTTVIIGTTRPNLLREAIDSVKSQTVECELIVIDGHIGACKALNKAVNKSHGKYIFNLDDDDILTENCIERLEQEIEDNDVIFSDLMLWYPDRIEPFRQKFEGYEALKESNTMPGVLMTTKEAALKVPFVEELNSGYDYERNLRFCEAELKIKHLPELLYYYRQHEGQTQKILKEEQTKNNLESARKRG